MGSTEIALLLAGGFFAGLVNTLAGGGSLLTVPLLVLVGLPGSVANGTNRVGILVQSAVAAWQFRAQGVFRMRSAVPVFVPAVAGAVLGAWLIAGVSDATFERLFGLAMLVLLVPTLRGGVRRSASSKGWSPAASSLVFFAIGVYAGALQAGVGLPLLLALTHRGLDLVRANAVKVAVIAVLTLSAVPIFVLADQIAWGPALLLAAGFGAGGAAGARLAVRGGARLVRPVVAIAVVALAGRMLGLY